jgi:hypothetical protein
MFIKPDFRRSSDSNEYMETDGELLSVSLTISKFTRATNSSSLVSGNNPYTTAFGADSLTHSVRFGTSASEISDSITISI